MRTASLTVLLVGLCSACSTGSRGEGVAFGSVTEALADAGTCAAGAGNATPFAGGTGTAASPYVICSWNSSRE